MAATKLTGFSAAGRVYEVFKAPSAISWTAARELALSLGGDLVSINSSTESSAIWSRISSISDIWTSNSLGQSIGPYIGLFQPAGSTEPSGGWRWVDGTPIGYAGWYPGQPDNAKSDSTAILFQKTANWADVPDEIGNWSSSTFILERSNFLPTGSVSITGAAVQGSTLTAVATLADLDGLGPLSFTWFADGQLIGGVSGNSLLLNQALVGKAVSVRASYTDGYGAAESVTSSRTSPVSSDTIPPTIRVATDSAALKIGETAVIRFTLSEGSNNFGNSDIQVSAGTLSSFSGIEAAYVATYTPPPNTEALITLAVPTGAFTDSAGNQNADGSDADNKVVLKVDTLAPTLGSTSPIAASVGVGLGANIVFTFSEAIQRGTGSIVIKTSSGTTVASYDVTSSVNLGISGNALTLDPSEPLSASVTYQVLVPAGAVRDLVGNSYSGLATPYQFTTRANTPPVGANGVASTTEDAQLTGRLPVGTDADGDQLSYAKVSDPSRGQVSVLADGRYVYTPARDFNGSDSFTYALSDGQGSAVIYRVDLSVTAVNDAPTVNAPLPDQSVAVGSGGISLTVPASTFVDIDTSNLTLSARLAGGAALPSWLSFSPETRTLSGTPGPANVGTLDVEVVASDGSLSASDVMRLTIKPDTTAPTVRFTDNVPGVASAVSGLAFTLTFSEAVAGLETSDFLVTNGSVNSVVGSGTVWTVGVTPASGLASGTLTLSLKAGSVTDASGNPNALASDVPQALDTLAPSARALSPNDGATNVSVDRQPTIAVSFSEAVRLAGTVTLKNAATGAVVQSFKAGDAGVTVSGDTITFTPQRLDTMASQLLDFGVGSVTDLVGNAFTPVQTYDFTTASADGLYHFFLVAFAAAPGKTYLGQLAEAWNFGLTLQQIVEIFTTKPQFTNVYPTTMSNRELATTLVENIVKTSATQAARNEAINDIETVLSAAVGWSRGKMLFTVFGNLANKPLADPIWGGTAMQFQKQLLVSKYFSELDAQGDTIDLAKLKAIAGAVSDTTDVSTTQKIVDIIGVALGRFPQDGVGTPDGGGGGGGGGGG